MKCKGAIRLDASDRKICKQPYVVSELCFQRRKENLSLSQIKSGYIDDAVRPGSDADNASSCLGGA
jgi:hypothetical protein